MLHGIAENGKQPLKTWDNFWQRAQHDFDGIVSELFWPSI